MRGRWGILAVLFAVRASMAFQYQSVASLAPLITRDLGVGLADIGLLFGLYLAPGIAIALPGGAIARRVGDKRMVLAGLAMMIAGGVVMATVPTWPTQIGGRLLAGTGGVFLNVLMSKMVGDWFGGREITTAMAVFVNSWPAGIALALVTLPPVGEAAGLATATWVAVALLAAGMLVLGLLYHPPSSPASSAPSGASTAIRGALIATVAAGVLWGLYNVGFAMVFAFGPSALTERGWSLTAAGSMVSVVLWLAIVFLPLSGLLADRLGLHRLFIVGGCLASAALLWTVSRTDLVMLPLIALGVVAGLPAGAIMSLPARVLPAQARAVGMGLFFTVFYAAMMVGPAIGGWVAAWLGSASIALEFGAMVFLACIPCVVIFQYLAAPHLSGAPSRPAGS